MKREVIEKPFDQRLHKKLPGRGGSPTIYVEAAEYIRRLNEATDGDWSFDVVEWKVYDKEVVVLGRLRHGDLVKAAFGGQPRNRGMDLGDALKAATTDALKKGSTFFGLGLEIHSKDFIPTPAEAPTKKAAEAAEPAEGHRGDTAHPAGQGITHRQLDAIKALRAQLGWGASALIEAIGDPMTLSRDAVQQQIEGLQKQILERAKVA